MERNTVTPRRLWYGVALLLFLLGLAAIPAAVMLSFVISPRPVQFKVPGAREFDLARSGKYVLWHDYQTIFQGKTFSSNALPGGLQMQLSNVASRAVIPLVPDPSTTVRMGNDARRSIATFTVGQPGKYILSVEGASAPMVFSFGPSTTRDVLLAVMTGFILAPTLIIAGLTVGLCVAVRRQRRKRGW